MGGHQGTGVLTHGQMTLGVGFDEVDQKKEQLGGLFALFKGFLKVFSESFPRGFKGFSYFFHFFLGFLWFFTICQDG